MSPAMRGASERPWSCMRRVDVDRARARCASPRSGARSPRSARSPTRSSCVPRLPWTSSGVAVGVLEVQRRHGDPIAAPAPATARVFLYVDPVGDDQERRRSRSSTWPSTCGSRLVPIALTSMRELAGDVAHDVGDALDEAEADRARLDGDVDRLFRAARRSTAPSGAVPTAVIQTPGA